MVVSFTSKVVSSVLDDSEVEDSEVDDED